MTDSVPLSPIVTSNPRINWVERISRVEAKVDQIFEFILPLQEKIEIALNKNAQSNERIAVHMEESKRVWNRIEELEGILSDQSKAIIRLSEALIELKEQQKQNIEFINSAKRSIGVLGVSLIAAMGWLLQKWIERGR